MANDLRSMARAAIQGNPIDPLRKPNPSAVVDVFEAVQDDIAENAAAATAAQTTANNALAFAGLGLKWTTNKVRVRSTANVVIASALENGDTLNGVTLATGNHVFLGSQTVPAQNGLYTVVASGAASRATWADSAAELARIGFVIQEGTAGTGERWMLPLDTADITVGTTALTFAPVGIEPGYAADVAAASSGFDSLDARLDGIDTLTTVFKAGASYPQAYPLGADLEEKVQAVVAANANVPFGSSTYTFDDDNIGALKPNRWYWGFGATILSSGLGPVATHETQSTIEGLRMVGKGGNPETPTTTDIGVLAPDEKGGSSTSGRFENFGTAAYQSSGAGGLLGQRITGRYYNNNVDFECLEGGEYNVFHGFNISSSAAFTVEDRYGTGAFLQGGNNALVGGTITFKLCGIDIVPGSNDAHATIVGILANHNTTNFRYGDVNTKAYTVVASAFHGGAIDLGGQGLLMMGNQFGSWDLTERAGADRSAVMGAVFLAMPTTYNPNTDGATAVSYSGLILPASVKGDDDWLKTTARSKRQRQTTSQVIAAGTGALVDFNGMLKNSLQANTAFSKYGLWDGTNKYWTMLTGKSPASDGRAHVDIILTIRRTDAGSFDYGAGFVVRLVFGGSGDTLDLTAGEWRPLNKDDNTVEPIGGLECIRCSINGAYEKFAKMGVFVQAPAGHAVEIMTHENGPSVADVWGW